MPKYVPFHSSPRTADSTETEKNSSMGGAAGNILGGLGGTAVGLALPVAAGAGLGYLGGEALSGPIADAIGASPLSGAISPEAISETLPIAGAGLGSLVGLPMMPAAGLAGATIGSQFGGNVGDSISNLIPSRQTPAAALAPETHQPAVSTVRAPTEEGQTTMGQHIAWNPTPATKEANWPRAIGRAVGGAMMLPGGVLPAVGSSIGGRMGRSGVAREYADQLPPEDLAKVRDSGGFLEGLGTTTLGGIGGGIAAGVPAALLSGADPVATAISALAGAGLGGGVTGYYAGDSTARGVADQLVEKRQQEEQIRQLQEFVAQQGAQPMPAKAASAEETLKAAASTLGRLGLLAGGLGLGAGAAYAGGAFDEGGVLNPGDLMDRLGWGGEGAPEVGAAAPGPVVGPAAGAVDGGDAALNLSGETGPGDWVPYSRPTSTMPGPLLHPLRMPEPVPPTPSGPLL